MFVCYVLCTVIYHVCGVVTVVTTRPPCRAYTCRGVYCFIQYSISHAFMCGGVIVVIPGTSYDMIMQAAVCGGVTAVNGISV